MGLSEPGNQKGKVQNLKNLKFLSQELLQHEDITWNLKLCWNNTSFSQNWRYEVLKLYSWFSLYESFLGFFCQENDPFLVILGHAGGNVSKNGPPLQFCWFQVPFLRIFQISSEKVGFLKNRWHHFFSSFFLRGSIFNVFGPFLCNFYNGHFWFRLRISK